MGKTILDFSDVASEAPSALAKGEIVINTADQLLYYKDSSETIGSIKLDGAIGDVLLTASASGSSSVAFESNIDSTYDHYVFEFSNVVTSTGGAILRIQTAPTGGGYATGVGAYTYSQIIMGSSDVSVSGLADTNGIHIPLFYGAGGNGSSGRVVLYSPSNTTQEKTITCLAGGVDNLGNTDLVITAGTRKGVVQDIGKLRFNSSAGTITSGEFKMYGMK
jgi:hypothetical protein